MTLSKKNILISLYLVLLHLLAALLITKTYTYQSALQAMGIKQQSHIESPSYRSTLTHQLRLDGNTTQDAFAFFGDSMIQGLNTSAIVNRSENYGIGFDTTYGLLTRLPLYRSSSIANKVFIGIGINDIGTLEPIQIVENIEKISRLIPSEHQIFVSGILPISKAVIMPERQDLINESNRALQDAMLKYPNVTYIPPPENIFNPAGYLKDDLHIGDGLHLNPQGYDLWIDYLKSKLE